MKHILKRVICLLLMTALCISLVPGSVFAVETDEKNDYRDVKPDAWYYQAVADVTAKGIFSGVSAHRFSPDGTLTRAMFVTILGRMAGVDPKDYPDDSDFADVKKGSWYAPYVAWAVKYGIATGISAAEFNPNGEVTRQEMAVFFVRYCDNFGIPLNDEVSAGEPEDIGLAADWGRDSLVRMWQCGLLSGSDGKNINAWGKASRAMAAVFCANLLRAVQEWKSVPDQKKSDSESKWNSVDEDIGGGSYCISFRESDGTLIKAVTVTSGRGVSDADVPTYSDPDPANGIYFWGWFYYQNGELYLYNNLYPYNTNMDVYAVCGTQGAVEEYFEDQFYVVEEDVPTTFAVRVRPVNAGTQPDPLLDVAVFANDYNERVACKVSSDGGDFLITADGLKEGVTYNMTLSNKFNLVVSADDGTGGTKLTELDNQYRYIIFKIAKPVNGDLLFRDDIIWIPESERDAFENQTEYGMGIARDFDNTGAALGTGSFTCPDAYGYTAGAVICVYNDDIAQVETADGTVPVQREAPNQRDYTEVSYASNGYTYADVYLMTDQDGNQISDSAFFEVTSVTDNHNGTVTCAYRELGNEDFSRIFYIPDVIPFSVSRLPDGTVGGTGTVNNYYRYDRETYLSYSDYELEEPEIGDFVAIYTKDVEDYTDQELEAMRSGTYEDEIPFVFGRIDSIDGKKLNYTVVTLETVIEAENSIDEYYVNRYIPASLTPEVTEEQLEVFEEEIRDTLNDEQFLEAFVFESIRKDADSGSEEAQQALQVLNSAAPGEMSFTAALPRVGKDPDQTKKVEITGSNVGINASPTLKYLNTGSGKWGYSFDVGMMLIVKLKLNDYSNMYYVISANFTQEFAIGLSAGGSFSVKWKVIIPVPKEISFSLSVSAETATDVTMDIRHYVTYSDVYTSIGEQSMTTQEAWNRFQEFLLCNSFVAYGAKLYALEAEYETLAANAAAIDIKDAEAKNEAEELARKKAVEINTFWNSYGQETDSQLTSAWKLYYTDGGDAISNAVKEEAAKKAAAVAKDELLAHVIAYTQNIKYVNTLVDKFTKDTDKKIEDAGTELRDLNSDGTETEESKNAAKLLEDAAAKEAELKKQNEEAKKKAKEDANNSADMVTYLNYAHKTMGYLADKITLAIDAVTVMKSAADSEGNTAAAAKCQEIIETLQDAYNTIKTAQQMTLTAKDLVTAITRFAAIANEDTNTMACLYSGISELNTALKDTRMVLVDMQKLLDKTDADDLKLWNELQEGIDVIANITKYSTTAIDLVGTLMKMVGIGFDKFGNVLDGHEMDGIRDVNTNSTFWAYRNLRTSIFQEFSLNTEIVDKLNAPDDGLNDDNIKILADKYAELCKITNTWMDLYRKTLVDKDIPIFAGLDVNIGVDFVVQADVNVAANFNFHLEYGKEFIVKMDVLHWNISTSAVDASNQELSVRLIAMGILGLRTGFEFKIGLTIIKIFKVNATVELMPYVMLYGYTIFEYQLNLSSGDSTTKLKGALYIDTGVHVGLNITLSLDVWVYKNTWRFNLWKHDFSIFDIGDRNNVYNFAYAQPSPYSLSAYQEDELKKIDDGTITETEKQEMNTGVDGLVIVNAATGFMLPDEARTMSGMDMTNGAINQSVFDADRFEYTFYTVPRSGSEASYQNGNLPVMYKTEEVAKTDAQGNVIYGSDVIEVGKDEKGNLVVKNVPETEIVTTDDLMIDWEGIRDHQYEEDTHFSVDADGVITYTPDVIDGSVYSGEVYVLVRWKEGALEFSNYPLRRVLHILWTNESPVTWCELNVVLVDHDESTHTTENTTVWTKTVAKGTKSVRIPSVDDVLAVYDPDGVMYETFSADAEGSSYYRSSRVDDRGTNISSIQESMDYYIDVVRKTYTMDIMTMDSNGEYQTTDTVSAIIGGTFVPKSPQMITKVTDGAGNTKYYRFVGYSAFFLSNAAANVTESGTPDYSKAGVWEKKWNDPIDVAMAKDLDNENSLYYLAAQYEDVTVEAVFHFEGIENYPDVTQTFMKGQSADMTEINRMIDRIKASAVGNEVIRCTVIPAVSAIDVNTQYTIDCRTITMEAPIVTSAEKATEVKLSSTTTRNEGDELVYGYSIGVDDVCSATWMYDFEDTDVMIIAPNTDYYFYCMLIDGATGVRTYSDGTRKRAEGTVAETGYDTKVTVYAKDTNTESVLVCISFLYNDGTKSDPVYSALLEPGDDTTLDMPDFYLPEDVAKISLTATDSAGNAPGSDCKFMLSGTSENGESTWESSVVNMTYRAGSTTAKSIAFTFSEN